MNTNEKVVLPVSLSTKYTGEVWVPTTAWRLSVPSSRSIKLNAVVSPAQIVPPPFVSPFEEHGPVALATPMMPAEARGDSNKANESTAEARTRIRPARADEDFMVDSPKEGYCNGPSKDSGTPDFRKCSRYSLLIRRSIQDMRNRFHNMRRGVLRLNRTSGLSPAPDPLYGEKPQIVTHRLLPGFAALGPLLRLIPR